jgi:hypothetical protein
MRLQQGPHPRVVGHLGVERTRRAAEQHRLTSPRGARRVRMGAAQPVVVQPGQRLCMSGDQPPWVADRGDHRVNRAAQLQVAQPGRWFQRVWLVQGQFHNGEVSMCTHK